MEVELDGQIINVTITRKNNKNMYLRVKADGIHISCNYLVPKKMILNFILDNEESILKSYARLQRKEKKKEEFYYLGQRYDVIISDSVSKIEFFDNRVFVKNKTYLKTFNVLLLYLQVLLQQYYLLQLILIQHYLLQFLHYHQF